MQDLTEQAENLQLQPRILSVKYCGICSAPPEYCEFGSNKQRTTCREWLQETDRELFLEIYGASEAPEAPANKPNAPESGLEPEPEPKNPKQKPSKSVKITIIERSKRKRITQIFGLENFGVDLKKASKMFASKFAASAAVSKNAAGADEILVQGDCSFEITDFIIDNFNVPEQAIVITEGKSKK
jgi:density-regulated protein DRP1